MIGQHKGSDKNSFRIYAGYHSLLVWFLLIIPVVSVYAQPKISGSLVDSSGNPVANATITFRVPGRTSTLGFTKSDSDGLFRFSVRLVDLDSLQLDIRHLSYLFMQVKIPNRTADHLFVLKEGDNLLETVNVGNPPIFIRRDTLNYHVDAFISTEDRVIADVIRRLPGIEIQEGQILYQGKPIQRYLVNNMDLMGGRYGLLNNNLPADAVRNIQVIENDQPIRILDSLVFSDRASLNLEIKKYTTTGSGKLGGGGGGGPILWDVGITPITLAKNFQALTSIQTNNVGHDAGKDIRSFYTGNVVDARSMFSQNQSSFFSLKNLNSPPMQEKKWRKNQVVLGSANILYKLDNDLELRSNIAYHRDILKQEGHVITQYFDQEYTFLTVEEINNRYNLQALDFGLNLEKNTSTIYFKNNTSFKGARDNDRGSVLFNNVDSILQHRHYHSYAFSNLFTGMRFVGEQMIYFSSSLNWQKAPQQLQIRPGQFADIFQEGEPFEQLTQHLDFSALDLVNSVYFIRRFGNWRIRPAFDLQYLSNHIQSHMEVFDQEQVNSLGKDFRNDIQNTWIRVATGTNISYERGQWVFDLNTPYTLHLMGNSIQSALNPSLRIAYHLNSRHDFTFNASGGPNYEGITRAFGGYILQSYRSLQRFQNQVLSSYSNNVRIGYNYKNETLGVFSNLSYGFNQQLRHYIYDTQLDDMGQITIDIQDGPSELQSHLVRGGVSRFIYPIRTLLKLNLSLGITQQDYLFNNRAGVRHSMRLGGNWEVSNSLSSFLSGTYMFDYNYINGQLSSGGTNNILATKHSLDLNFFLFRKYTITIHQALYDQHIQAHTASYFMDFTYKYRINKWKMDLDASAINLWGNQRYIQKVSYDNQLVQSIFELRPRQFLLTVKFQF